MAESKAVKAKKAAVQALRAEGMSLDEIEAANPDLKAGVDALRKTVEKAPEPRRPGSTGTIARGRPAF